MMRFRHWVLFSLASLLLVGYTGKLWFQQARTQQPTTQQTDDHNARATASKSVTQLQQPEAIAQVMTATKPVVVRSGNFVAGEHPTQGIVRIIRQNGKSFLELDQSFKTSSMGPDLVVILHRSANVIGSTKPPAYPLKTGDYVLLAPLRKFSGSQRYAIPSTVNLANYQSAAIWCRKFNATFGAARLTTQSGQ